MKDLPDICYSVLNTTGELIVIKKGESGYYPIKMYKVLKKGVTARQMADELNKGNCTPEQEEAMVAGSMFGWDCPAAQPK